MNLAMMSMSLSNSYLAISQYIHWESANNSIISWNASQQRNTTIQLIEDSLGSSELHQNLGHLRVVNLHLIDGIFLVRRRVVLTTPGSQTLPFSSHLRHIAQIKIYRGDYEHHGVVDISSYLQVIFGIVGVRNGSESEGAGAIDSQCVVDGVVLLILGYKQRVDSGAFVLRHFA